MKEYKHLKFPNNANGQKKKIKALEDASRDGWRVISENIVQGKFRGKRACCLSVFALPCAFLSGHSDGEIQVTLERDRLRS